MLKRVNPRNVQLLATIVKQSLLPSICEKTNEEIDQLCKIDLNPNLLFDKIFKEKLKSLQQKDLKEINKLLLKEHQIFLSLFYLWKSI